MGASYRLSLTLTVMFVTHNRKADSWRGVCFSKRCGFPCQNMCRSAQESNQSIEHGRLCPAGGRGQWDCPSGSSAIWPDSGIRLITFWQRAAMTGKAECSGRLLGEEARVGFCVSGFAQWLASQSGDPRGSDTVRTWCIDVRPITSFRVERPANSDQTRASVFRKRRATLHSNSASPQMRGQDDATGRGVRPASEGARRWQTQRLP
jgi:hypothetical protein